MQQLFDVLHGGVVQATCAHTALALLDTGNNGRSRCRITEKCHLGMYIHVISMVVNDFTCDFNFKALLQLPTFRTASDKSCAEAWERG